ncbi:MAG: lipid-A-disaccharide synthase [Epsilonproteobacteria bacterium]|nr:lipid-A-disaccharide synthase [Campylobacterota bacterium]
MKKILISALEPSANLHLEPILNILGEYELKGIFDPKFGSPLYPSSDFSVMGFVDVLWKIKKAKRAIKEMVKLSFECETVLLIDSPAFNLPLAKAIKEKNPDIKIVYYILPQVWAWKEKRVKKIEKYCDVLASILPFESKFYNKSTYVGHPLLDEIKIFKENVTHNNKVAFLPGSRKSEIKSLMNIYKEVAKEIKEDKIVVIPKHFGQDQIKELYGDLSGFDIYYSTEQALNEADFAFICSGTATLESSIIGTPFVLVYKAKKIDYFIAKRFVKLKHIGLANIIFDFEGEEDLHKELIQDDVTKENLLKEYKDINRGYFMEKSKRLRGILKHGSAKNVADMI